MKIRKTNRLIVLLFLAYLMAGWQQLDEQQPFEAELEIERVVQKFQAGAITIANTAPPTSVLAQGGGKVIVDDGLLDITIGVAGSETTKLEALGAIANLFGSATLPDIYLGSWDGHGLQDNGSQWSILVTLTSGKTGSVVGTIAYPSLRCGGELILKSVDSNNIKLYENLTFGKNSCVNGETIILQPTGGNYLNFLWFYPNGSHGANGILRRK